MNLMQMLSNPGMLLFVAIKVVGYSYLLLMVYKNSNKLVAPLAGSVRALMGLALGAVILVTAPNLASKLYLFYAVILVIRMIEWVMVLKLFYRHEEMSLKRLALFTLASSLLDLFAVAGLVSVDGLIC